jgi:hypothetical protein
MVSFWLGHVEQLISLPLRWLYVRPQNSSLSPRNNPRPTARTSSDTWASSKVGGNSAWRMPFAADHKSQHRRLCQSVPRCNGGIGLLVAPGGPTRNYLWKKESCGPSDGPMPGGNGSSSLNSGQSPKSTRWSAIGLKRQSAYNLHLSGLGGGRNTMSILLVGLRPFLQSRLAYL